MHIYRQNSTSIKNKDSIGSNSSCSTSISKH